MTRDKAVLSDTPHDGYRYRHFKGATYTVVCIADHTESGERLVVYRGPLGGLWARPYADWMSSPDGHRRRFVAEHPSLAVSKQEAHSEADPRKRVPVQEGDR